MKTMATRWGGGVLVLALVLAAGCAGGKSPTDQVIMESVVMETDGIYAQAPGAEDYEPAPTGADLMYDFTDYTIGAGDVLLFRSFDDASLSAEVVVRYDGHISLPLIPDVNLRGSTRDEAITSLQAAYESLFREPQLSLAILEARSKTFTVMGDVSAPGEFAYARPITLLDAINQAGGLRINQRAGDTFVAAQGQLIKALIIREIDGERTVRSFDLRDFDESGNHASQTPVYPDDIVYVPEGVNLVYVLGEARRPDVHTITDSTTLLQLLAYAGGFVEQNARMRNVILMRQVDETHTKIMHINIRRIFRTGQDIRILPGDVLYIPRKPLLNVQAFVQRFTGSISPLINLYTQSLNAWYAQDRIDLLLDDAQSSNIVDILQNISAVGAAF